MAGGAIHCQRRVIVTITFVVAAFLLPQAQAIPPKFDALQPALGVKPKRSAATTTAAAASPEEEDDEAIQFDPDVLSRVAYGNPRRWIVKVWDDVAARSPDYASCEDAVDALCRQAADASDPSFRGLCAWRDDAPSASATNGTSATDLPVGCFFTFESATPTDVDKLLVAHASAIEYVERDMRVIAEQSSCSYAFPQRDAPWHLDRIDATSATALDKTYAPPQGSTGADVHAYVLDTGVRSSHREFAGRVGRGANVLSGGRSAEDNNGHGTAVASLIAGGEFGVCKCCTVHSVKCLDAQGDGSYTDVIAGLMWVLRNVERPAVVTMSLSGPTSQAINQVIRQLYDANIVTIAAAGNENVNACDRSPGSSRDAVTVGSSERRGSGGDARSDFSNYGSCVDIYAPGSDVTTADNSGDAATRVRSGTSFAAPQVAGALALYLAEYPTSSAASQKEKIEEASVSKDAIESEARLLMLRNLDVCPASQAPQTCRLGPWTDWGPSCPPPSDACGRPMQERSREILQEPSCGAAACAVTEERRACEGASRARAPSRRSGSAPTIRSFGLPKTLTLLDVPSSTRPRGGGEGEGRLVRASTITRGGLLSRTSPRRRRLTLPTIASWK